MTASSGQLSPARGGTGLDGSAAANGQLLIGNGSGFTLAALTQGSGITITNSAGGITIASTGGGAALSGITAATGSNTLANGNNTGQVWNWANTTNSTVAFTFGETTAATNGTSTSGVPNQVLLKLTTLAASTQSPLSVYSQGNHVFSVSPTTAQILAANGNGSSVTYSFAGSTNSGMFMSGSNLTFSAGGAAFLQSSGGSVVFNKTAVCLGGTSTAPSLTDGPFTVTGLYWPANHTIAIADTVSGEVARFTGGNANYGYMTMMAVTFANLPAAANGSVLYCSDCTIANPCAGSGTGALAKRLNGAWVCN